VFTFGSLFSGIGGIDLGLDRAGMVCRWQVEIDPFCRRVLAKHWPDVPKFGDIRELTGGELERVDLIAGGFPCQPHSLAGKRQASADERDLWGEFARIIRRVKPRWVLAENVPGLLSSESGRFFGRVLGDLAEAGYDAEWSCIPAAAVGAPHIRDRVWILAYPRREHRGQAEQGINQCDCVFPQGKRWAASERSEDRQLVALVPGIHPRASEDWWRAQSGMARSANGVPNRVDRLRGLGNAVVPQVAEWIGRRIVEADAIRDS
jgi:DNA (cytosine-5)-methyltransferase 1